MIWAVACTPASVRPAQTIRGGASSRARRASCSAATTDLSELTASLVALALGDLGEPALGIGEVDGNVCGPADDGDLDLVGGLRGARTEGEEHGCDGQQAFHDGFAHGIVPLRAASPRSAFPALGAFSGLTGGLRKISGRHMAARAGTSWASRAGGRAWAGSFAHGLFAAASPSVMQSAKMSLRTREHALPNAQGAEMSERTTPPFRADDAGGGAVADPA